MATLILRSSCYSSTLPGNIQSDFSNDGRISGGDDYSSSRRSRGEKVKNNYFSERSTAATSSSAESVESSSSTPGGIPKRIHRNSLKSNPKSSCSDGGIRGHEDDQFQKRSHVSDEMTLRRMEFREKLSSLPLQCDVTVIYPAHSWSMTGVEASDGFGTGARIELKMENQPLRPCGRDNVVSLTGLSSAYGSDAERRTIDGRSSNHYFIGFTNCHAIWSSENDGGYDDDTELLPVDITPYMFEVGFSGAAEDSSWILDGDEDEDEYDDYDEYYTGDEGDATIGKDSNFHTAVREAHVSFDFSRAMDWYVANAAKTSVVGSHNTAQEKAESCVTDLDDYNIERKDHEFNELKWAAKYSSINDTERKALFASIQKESRTIDMTLKLLFGMMIIFVPVLAWVVWRGLSVSSANFRKKGANAGMTGHRNSCDGSSPSIDSFFSRFGVVVSRNNRKEIVSKPEEHQYELPQCLGSVGQGIVNEVKKEIIPKPPTKHSPKLSPSKRSSDDSPPRKASIAVHGNENAPPASPRHWYDEYLSPRTSVFNKNEVNGESISIPARNGVNGVGASKVFTSNSNGKENLPFGGKVIRATHKVNENAAKTKLSFAPKPKFSKMTHATKNPDPFVRSAVVEHKTGAETSVGEKISYVRTASRKPYDQSTDFIPLQQTEPAARRNVNVKTFSFTKNDPPPRIQFAPSSSSHMKDSATLAESRNAAGNKFSFAQNLKSKHQSKGSSSIPSNSNATTAKSDQSIEKFSFTKKDQVCEEEPEKVASVKKDSAVNGKENAITFKVSSITKSQPEITPYKSSFFPSPCSVSLLKLSHDIEASASPILKADECVDEDEAGAPTISAFPNLEIGANETDAEATTRSPSFPTGPKLSFPATIVDQSHQVQKSGRKFDNASSSRQASPLGSPSGSGNDSVSSSKSFDNELKLKVKSRMSRANAMVPQDPPKRIKNKVSLHLGSASRGEIDTANCSYLSSEPSTPYTSEDGEDNDSIEAQPETGEVEEESESSSLSESETGAKQQHQEDQEDAISNESSEDDTAARAAKTERAFHDMKRNVIIELQVKTKNRSTCFGVRQTSSADKENGFDSDALFVGKDIDRFAEELAKKASKKKTNEKKSSRKSLVPVEQVSDSVQGSPLTSQVEDDSFLADYW
ncbi:hypothetical protein ACHAXS_004619 [Conticribra weissflogii]